MIGGEGEMPPSVKTQMYLLLTQNHRHDRLQADFVQCPSL